MDKNVDFLDNINVRYNEGDNLYGLLLQHPRNHSGSEFIELVKCEGKNSAFDITREFEGKRIRYTYANRNDFNIGKHPERITIYNDGEIQEYLAHTDRYLQVKPKYDKDNIRLIPISEILEGEKSVNSQIPPISNQLKELLKDKNFNELSNRFKKSKSKGEICFSIPTWLHVSFNGENIYENEKLRISLTNSLENGVEVEEWAETETEDSQKEGRRVTIGDFKLTRNVYIPRENSDGKDFVQVIETYSSREDYNKANKPKKVVIRNKKAKYSTLKYTWSEEDEKYIVTDKEGKDSFATYDNYRETLEMIGIPDYSYLLNYELQDENFASVLESINDISAAGSRYLKISKSKAADALESHAGQGEDGDGNPGVPSDVSRDEK